MPDFDLTEGVVHDLTFGGSPGVGQVDAPESMRWDCSIGGLSFLYAISDQFPMRRETADFRRQRIDTERNPGEQSLDSGYWLRSQSSWHYGQGLTSAEPIEVNSDEAQFRYKEGGGIDPWTPGQLSLLHATEKAFDSSGSAQYLLGVDTGVIHADATTMSYIPATGASASITWGGSASAITSLTSDGANWYAANAVGIYKGALPSGAGTKIWDTGSPTLVRWVKSRLVACVGRGIYELTASAGPTLPTALDAGGSRPTGWTWTDIAEGPAAIYVAGGVGDKSVIERITVSTSSSSVTLDVPTVVAEMPRGETVLSLYSYVGSYLIIGTTEGCRVAAITATGSLSMGPLIVTAGPVDDIVAIGNFVYVTVRDQGNAGDRASRAGLYRIDLGQSINDSTLDYASAADLVAPSGTTGMAKQVTTVDGDLWFTVTGSGVFRQSTDYVSDGWIETGRIRLGTVEKKGWRDLRVLTADDSGGTVTAWANTVDDSAPSNWTTVITGDGSRTDTTGKLTSAAPTPSTNLYVAFQLSAGDSNTTTPLFIGYQVRAVPAPERTRLIQVPVKLFDEQTDRQGQRFGKAGYAWGVLQQLEELEESSAVVQWRDYTTGEAATAYVEKVSMYRLTPPSKSLLSGKNAGGVCVVLLRLV